MNRFETIQHGIYLWILHADKIPPHIGISVNGSYFSLKYNGKDENIPVQSVLRLLEKKRIPSIIQEMKMDFTLEQLQSIYKSFMCAETSKASCLSPIVKLIYNQQLDLILPELLTRLSQEERLGKQFLLHLNPNFAAEFTYNREDIQRRLTLLHDAKRKEHLLKSH